MSSSAPVGSASSSSTYVGAQSSHLTKETKETLLSRLDGVINAIQVNQATKPKLNDSAKQGLRNLITLRKDIDNIPLNKTLPPISEIEWGAFAKAPKAEEKAQKPVDKAITNLTTLEEQAEVLSKKIDDLKKIRDTKDLNSTEFEAEYEECVTVYRSLQEQQKNAIKARINLAKVWNLTSQNLQKLDLNITTLDADFIHYPKIRQLYEQVSSLDKDVSLLLSNAENINPNNLEEYSNTYNSLSNYYKELKGKSNELQEQTLKYISQLDVQIKEKTTQKVPARFTEHFERFTPVLKKEIDEEFKSTYESHLQECRNLRSQLTTTWNDLSVKLFEIFSNLNILSDLETRVRFDQLIEQSNELLKQLYVSDNKDSFYNIALFQNKQKWDEISNEFEKLKNTEEREKTAAELQKAIIDITYRLYEDSKETKFNTLFNDMSSFAHYDDVDYPKENVNAVTQTLKNSWEILSQTREKLRKQYIEKWNDLTLTRSDINHFIYLTESASSVMPLATTLHNSLRWLAESTHKTIRKARDENSTLIELKNQYQLDLDFTSVKNCLVKAGIVEDSCSTFTEIPDEKKLLMMGTIFANSFITNNLSASFKMEMPTRSSILTTNNFIFHKPEEEGNVEREIKQKNEEHAEYITKLEISLENKVQENIVDQQDVFYQIERLLYHANIAVIKEKVYQGIHWNGYLNTYGAIAYVTQLTEKLGNRIEYIK